MLDSALGAGTALLNLLPLRYANGNCGGGQRLKGPAFLSALRASLSAAWAVAAVRFGACSSTGDQVVCSEAEHTGQVVKAFR